MPYRPARRRFVKPMPKQPEIDPEVHARAREAVRVFRTMQPGLTGLASALAGKELPVVLDTASEGERASRTDGSRIFYTPPIALGDRVPHERRLCDRRNEKGRMICPACAIREKVQADIYHEVAHNAFGTFRKPDTKEVKDAVQVAVAERGTKYLQEIEKQVKALDSRDKLSLMPLAGMISPYLPSMFNALEDARVDERMYRARVGTRVIMRADYIDIFENGTHTLTKGQVMWRDAPLQAQLTIGLFCIGSGLPYRQYLCEAAVKALEDPEIFDAVENIAESETSAETFATSLKVLARFRELGYFKSDKDPEDAEPEPEPEQDPEEEENDAPDREDSDDRDEQSEGDPEADPSASPDADDHHDGFGPGAPDPSSGVDEDGDSGEPEDPDAPEADGESGASDPAGGADADSDDLGEGDGQQEDPVDPAGADSAEPDSPEGLPEDGVDAGSPDEDGDDAGAPQPGDDGTAGEVPEDQEAAPSSGGGGSEGSSADGGSDEGELTDDQAQEGDQPGESGGEPGEPGESGGDQSSGGSADSGGADGGQGDPDDREDLDQSDLQHDDSGSDHEVGRPGDDGGDDPDGYDNDDQARTDSREERNEGGDPGLESDGEGSGVQEPGPVPVPDLGTEEEVAAALEQFTEHMDVADVEDPDSEEERAPRHGNPDMTGDEIKAIQTAVLQEKFFDSPSVGVSGVAEARFRDFSQIPFAQNAWGSAGHSNATGDYDVPEEILGKGLMELRRALTDNARAAFERHLKSGKINQRSLGKRAWNSDPRLFQKKRLPGKRSYSVIIGIDISGSTAGRNIYLAKRAAFAQAQLCDRLGIEFSIYAHSARSGVRRGDSGFIMDIYEVKAADEIWGPNQQNALRSLQDCYNNLDGHTIEYYRKKIERRNATDKIILYYTDGAMPASNRGEETEILIREIGICKKKNITLLGVGIRTDSPTQYGLDTVKVDKDEDLVEVVRHLERALLHAR